MPADPIRLLSLNPEEAKELRAGQACLLSGPLFTLRDAGHQRLLAEMGDSKEPPYGLTGQTISMQGQPFGSRASVWHYRPHHCFANGLCGSSSYGLRSCRNGG